jgi:hypothetical protein
MIRVRLPTAAAMPHMCCSCATTEGVQLVDTKLSDDVKRRRFTLPFCGTCAEKDRASARRWFAGVLVAMGAIMGTLAVFETTSKAWNAWGVAFLVGAVAFLAWRIAPQLRQRPVKLIRYEQRQGFMTLGCENQRFADALADQNVTASEANLPQARIH